MAQLFGNLPQVLGPFLFGMQAGSMVGQLAFRAMGQYDLPMPRPPRDELMLVSTTIDGFASDWSLAARRRPPVGLPAGSHQQRRAAAGRMFGHASRRR